MDAQVNRKADFALASILCLAVVGYWAWDSSVHVVSAVSAVKKESFNDDGFRLYLNSDYAGAEALFRKAIRANPADGLGFCNLGAALIAERKFDEAITALRTAIALDPSLTLARNNLQWAIEERAKHGN